MSPLAFGAFRLRPRTSAFIAATLLLAWVFSARPSISAPVPYEQTTVAELLRQEIQIHALPPDMISLAKAAVETSASAAERVSRLPADRQTALRALGEINIQLARMNFLQPLSEDLWANALSEALTPHDANDSAVVLALEEVALMTDIEQAGEADERLQIVGDDAIHGFVEVLLLRGIGGVTKGDATQVALRETYDDRIG